MGYFIIGDRLETLPRGLLGKRRHSTERLTINVYRLSLLGRTSTMDPLAEKYYSLSPYTWCAGNPVKFVDQDGRIIIFINGMHVDSGGKSQYWNGLDKKIQVSLNDMNSMYLDGSSGGVLHIAIPLIYKGNLNPQSRISCGLRKGLFIAQSIYNNLGNDESITIVTHSMGAAYAKGFITALQLYAIVNGIDHRIKMEIDLAPFQPLLQMKCPGITTIVVSHLFDHVAGFMPIIGANNNITRTDESFFNIITEHSIDSFTIEEIECIINSILKSESK